MRLQIEREKPKTKAFVKQNIAVLVLLVLMNCVTFYITRNPISMFGAGFVLGVLFSILSEIKQEKDLQKLEIEMIEEALPALRKDVIETHGVEQWEKMKEDMNIIEVVDSQE